MTDCAFVEATEPEDAFATLADPMRLEILLALWEADGPRATFGELREAVGANDSGHFNYHLQQFDGRFVEATDDGYKLRLPGRTVVGALIAGIYTERGSVGPIALDDPCYLCGGEVTAAYADERVTLECETCGQLSRIEVHPGVLAGRPVETVPDVIEQYARTRFRKAVRGFCYNCDGPTTAELLTAAETTDERSDPSVPLAEIPMVTLECERCGWQTDVNLGIALVDHPAVISFYHEHGVDYRDIPLWRLAVSTPDHASVERETPMRASVTYTAPSGDEGADPESSSELTVTVDESATVLETNRDDGDRSSP